MLPPVTAATVEVQDQAASVALNELHDVEDVEESVHADAAGKLAVPGGPTDFGAAPDEEHDIWQPGQ